ncbi:MAG: cyclic nucleotide-binding domain-containing protein [Planctomycetes bacterium]|nr:cyclic nucleotide-binding domain-containing protein [Planctomycetota bacterium]
MAKNARDILRSLEVTFAKGQIIFAEGDKSRDFYILLGGEVEIRKNDRTIAVLAEPDSYIGEMSTLLGTNRTATAVARTDCKLIKVPEERVADFFAHSPSLGLKLARLLARRLNEMNDRYEKMLVEKVPDASAGQNVFEKLTANSNHRRFLEFYREHMGQTLTLRDVMIRVEIPSSEFNRIFMTFGMAGLIEINERQITFNNAEDLSLRHMILNWTGRKR